MKINLIYVFIFISVIYYTQSKIKRRKWCHFNEVLIRCTDDLRAFTSRINGTGIPANSRAFDAFCYYGHTKLPNCIRKWTQKCGTEIYQELIEQLYVKPLIESAKNFCEITNKNKFLKHSPCLHAKVKLSQEYRIKCVKQIQSAFEYSQINYANESYATKFRSMCCAYNQWENCIKGFLQNDCGGMSDEIIVDLIRAGTVTFVHQFCPQSMYDPNSSVCKQLLPTNFSPKGFKSNSIFSYMFSYWCPNVGYGIIPERD